METVPLEAERKSGRRHAQGGKTLMPPKLEQISDKGNGGHLSCLLHRRRVGVPVPSPKKEKDIRKGDEADCCWRSGRPTMAVGQLLSLHTSGLAVANGDWDNLLRRSP